MAKSVLYAWSLVKFSFHQAPISEKRKFSAQVFTSFFALEAALKLMALSKEYFSSGWNIFDLIIVIASLIDLSVESVNGISVLRGMRLVRNWQLKLVFTWQHFGTPFFRCCVSDEGVEAGPVLDDDEGAAEHHHIDAGRARQPHLPAHHRHLHLRRARHAALRQDLHPGQLRPGPSAKVSLSVCPTEKDFLGLHEPLKRGKGSVLSLSFSFFLPQVELHRLLPFLHDDLPHSVRRVDRAALGLHESGGKSGATFFETTI